MKRHNRIIPLVIATLVALSLLGIHCVTEPDAELVRSTLGNIQAQKTAVVEYSREQNTKVWELWNAPYLNATRTPTPTLLPLSKR